MSFYKRYELARLIQEGDAKTFRAVEIATGREVLLHLLAPSAALSTASLREIVARAEHQPQVIEVGEFAGSYYIATEPSDSFQSFRQWVDSLPPAPAPSKEPPPAPPAPPVTASRKLPEIRKLTVKPSPPLPQAAGEFTDIFGVPKAKIAGKVETGEFTRLFYGKSPPKPSTLVPEPAGDKIDTSGEFTQFFGGPRPGQPSPQVNERIVDEFKPVFDAPLGEPDDAPPVAADSPAPIWQDAIGEQPAGKEDPTGEYTKFFGNSLPGDPVDIPAEHAKQAGLVEPKNKPFRQASDFTRMFGPAGNAAKSPPPAVPSDTPAGDSSVSIIFGTPKPPAPKPAEPAQNIFSAAAEDSRTEADDYARVIGARNDSGMIHAAPPTPPGPPADKKHTGLILVLGLVGIILLSLLVWVLVSRGAK